MNHFLLTAAIFEGRLVAMAIACFFAGVIVF